MSFDITEFGYSGFTLGEGSQGVAISALSVLMTFLRPISELLKINPTKNFGSAGFCHNMNLKGASDTKAIQACTIATQGAVNLTPQ